MKRLALLAISLLAVPAVADVTVIDNNKTVTIDCAKDKTVMLMGNKIKATLSGTCEKLNVSGNKIEVTGSTKHAYVAGSDNTLALEGVDLISVPGNDNTVTYKTTVAKKKTSITNPGKRNKITQTR